MRKLFLVPLAIACTLVAASASAAEVETIALFDPAVLETPESIQIDRHGNIYVSLALTGESCKIAQTAPEDEERKYQPLFRHAAATARLHRRPRRAARRSAVWTYR